MTSALATSAATSASPPSSHGNPLQDPRERLRLRLKPKAPITGRVDGGWWPRSRDLATELPSLLAVLAVRLGHIERVSYHLCEWGPSPRRIHDDGGVVRLEGFRTQRANTVQVLAARERVTLLVVDPEASDETAHAVLMAAGQRGNTDDIDSLLRSRPPTGKVLPSTDGQLEREPESEEPDGGRTAFHRLAAHIHLPRADRR